MATNGGGSVSGADMTFTTLPVPPSPHLTSVTDVTQTSVTLRRRVTSSVPAHFHVEYGTTAMLGTSTPVPDQDVAALSDCYIPYGGGLPHGLASPEDWCINGLEAQEAAGPVTLDSLLPGTTYHVRLVAANDAGTVATADTTFTTLSLGPAPADIAPPTLTGNAAFGDTLTCHPGTWSDATGFTYAWLSGGTVVADGSDPMYTVSLGDIGKRIACRVAATSPGDATGTAQTTLTLDQIARHLLGDAPHYMLRAQVTLGAGSRPVTIEISSDF
jgi:hypothetical protein